MYSPLSGDPLFDVARSTGLWLSTLLLMASACLSARAQASPTPSPTPPAVGLTFEEIYQFAERDNLLINAVRRRRAVAEAEMIIAGERPNPDFITAYTRSEPRLNYSVSQLVELGGKRGRRIV